MGSLFRPTKTRADGSKVKTRLWWGKFRHPATGQVVKIALKTADKTAARQILAEHERKAALEAAGLVSPCEKHLKRPLSEHLADFERALQAKGNTEKHVALTLKRTRRILSGIRADYFRDVTPSRVEDFLANLQRQGLSAETRNHYLRAIKNFFNWMVKDGRAPENPIKTLSLVNSRPDRRVNRRALSVDELRRLLETTARGPVRYGMTGSERALLYRLAVETGLRAYELRSLKVNDFDLDADPPTVTIRAAYAKNRRTDTLPLRLETARSLKQFFTDKGPVERAFQVPPNYDTADMFRADLEAAGIPYIDESGRRADFHALRHTFITNLARSGVHPKVAQALARHSTITLTLDRYSHTVLTDLSEAVSVLPDLDAADASEAGQRRQVVGAGPVNNSNLVVPMVVPDARKKAVSAATCCNENVTLHKNEKGPKPGLSAANFNELQSASSTAPRGIRTPDPRIKNPLLYQLS